MKTFLKYMSGLNMFAAGVMMVLMVDEFVKGNTMSGILSAVICATNLISYFDNEKKNESLR